MPQTDSSVAKKLDVLKAHAWSPQPEPAKLVHRILNECLARSSVAAQLSRRMLAETGTRILDWLDHFGLRDDDPVISELPRVGYLEVDAGRGETVWHHPGGIFPEMRKLEGDTRH